MCGGTLLAMSADQDTMKKEIAKMELSNLSLADLKALVRAREIMDRADGHQEAPPRGKPAKAKKAIESETKEKDWAKVIKTCPKCGIIGPVKTVFGIKPMRGVFYAQSWCSQCRATTQYARKPRAYASKNNR